MNSLRDEKRRFKRIFHDASTYIVTPNSTSIPCNLLDISLNGCLISGSQDTETFQIDDHLTLNIVLGEALSIEALAHIVFISDKNKLASSLMVLILIALLL